MLECNEYNENSYFLRDIINSMDIDQTSYKWIISDLDLVPIFYGDYSGIGGETPQSIAYDFFKRIEQEKIAVLNCSELFTILKDTRTVYRGVFICLEKQYYININTYRPEVENDKPEEMYDDRAKYEIRILDGELFFILEK